jgi:ATP-dependent Lon protease
LSCAANIVIPSTIAFTGVVSLKGKISRIGGLFEKLIGAKKSGIKIVFIPADNETDLKKIDKRYLSGLEIIMVSNYEEIYNWFFRNIKATEN